MYLGKYGHSLTPFVRKTPGLVEKPVLFFLCGDRAPTVQAPGGATPQTASYSSDVFRTALGSDSNGGRTGMLCNTGNTECSGRGVCCSALKSENVSADRVATVSFQAECSDVDLGGCVCDRGFGGEFCEVSVKTAGAGRGRGATGAVLAFLLPLFLSWAAA